jgi:hypothetical protein
MSSLDFDFEGVSRSALVGEAMKQARTLASELGVGDEAQNEAADPATTLLEQLNLEVAEWGEFPDLVELKEEHFSQRGFPVPPQFKDLRSRYRFYWVRFPLTLKPLSVDHPFCNLKCVVEFAPGVKEGHLRPIARTILPDRKFKQLLELKQGIEFHIGENLEFEADTGPLKAVLAAAGGKAQAAVDAKVAAQMGAAAGPFEYRLKRAQLDHSPAGTAKVFWSFDDTEFLQEEEPTLITVMQVPRELRQLQIAAALQASHKFQALSASLGTVLKHVRTQVATFFRRGAPLQHTKLWDLTPRL